MHTPRVPACCLSSGNGAPSTPLTKLKWGILIKSTGQSGNPLLVQYDDYAQAWRDGRDLPILTDRTRIEENAPGALVQSPT